MPTRNPKLEFVNDETTRTLIDQRLAGVEQEVVNAQIDLRLEEAVASTFKEGERPSAGYPGSEANVAQRQQAYDSAIARLEALRAIRDESSPAKEAAKS